MNKGIWFLAVAGVLVTYGCSKPKESAVPVTAQEAEQAQVVSEQAQVVAKQATDNAQEAKVNAQQMAANVSGQIQDFLAKAKAFVDSGKFNEAITQAQEVLKLDPNNTTAQGIIETAKVKIMALAQQKAAEAKQILAEKLGAFGK